jgi:hypothetical protein
MVYAGAMCALADVKATDRMAAKASAVALGIRQVWEL